jgi:SnoaL-like domain
MDLELRLLLDERAIRRCVLHYCHGTDRHDWRMVADCYSPSAVDDHGSRTGASSVAASSTTSPTRSSRLRATRPPARATSSATSWSSDAARTFTVGRHDGTDPAQLAFAALAAVRG